MASRQDSQNLRVIHLAKSVLSLPYWAVRSVYRLVRRLTRSGMSAGDLRAEDQARQSRARRTLRGLSADHDATRTGP